MKSKHISVVLHVGGLMSFGGDVKYNGGRTLKYRQVDCDLIGYFTLIVIAKHSSCKVQRILYSFPGNSSSLVREISGDPGVLDMISFCEDGDKIDVYCEGEEEKLSNDEEEESVDSGNEYEISVGVDSVKSL